MTAASQEGWKPAYNPWLIAVVVSLAAFMEVLDTSIANVALPYIAGSMGASNDESTWVLTSYLVSNAIVLPISGWVATQFGRKRLFMTCIFFFTVSSLLCAIAPSLDVLLVSRVLQGIAGGGLQPLAQAILADSFPPEKRGLAFSVYGATAIFAPAIGPTLGGWITDNYSWRWIFLINLPVGFLALALVSHLVADPPYLARSRTAGVRIDYMGFALLALGIGALQVMLDRGQEDDWFGSRFIITLAIVAAVCLTAFVLYEWFRKDPIVEVRLFTNLNFAVANMLMFMMGVTLFAGVVMMPQFLQALMGYTAENAGMVLSLGALLVVLELPLIGRLTTVIQARYLIAAGWILMACAMYLSTQRTDLFISFGAAAWLRVTQAIPIGLVFIPLTAVAYIGIRPEKSNVVSAMVNFMRNIGASVGTSMVTTVVARRAQFHQVHLISRLAADDPVFNERLQAMTRQFEEAGAGTDQAQQQAYGELYAMVQNQAHTLAFIDAYWLLAVGALIMFCLTFLLKRNDPRATGGAPAH
ncbi:MAG TPA: DHA2 family efflux MFS transporter permease subunit [Acidobacteriaceae bacterium]|nr:DHA2 family efflux MFS transporter permease subunit [Acidobacteriaceae bacterium]